MASSANSPCVLIVDDNQDLLHFLERLLSKAGWNLLTAESARDARHLVQENRPNAALLDFMLPDGNGVELGVEFLQAIPNMLVIIMTGTILPAEEEALCEEHNFPVLRKPFLASDVINQIRTRLIPITGAAEPELQPNRRNIAEDTENVSGRALRVFFCYSHRDEKLRDKLAVHLSGLKHMGIIHSWHDRKISAGSEWEAKIDKYLFSADLILLLISPDFLNSDYCYRKEMEQALERHRRGEARVIPVILRPVDWQTAPFAKLQAVPKDGKPITQWANRDQGYLDASKSIRRAAEELSETIRRG